MRCGNTLKLKCFRKFVLTSLACGFITINGKVLQINSAHIKQLLRGGDIEKLEQVVFEGQGRKLIGEYSSDYKVRTYLKTVPALMTKISLLHDAVNSGRLEELQSLLEDEPDKKKKLVLAKDESGVGLLHKAVYYDLKDIAKWLIENFPNTVNMKDSEGRTPYHYTPMCRDKAGMQKFLKNAGADPSAVDFRQRSPKYYMDHSSELELPSPHKIDNSRRNTANKDGDQTTITNISKGLVIKKSNIRIWIHQKNLADLQQVVWEGHGSKLLVEHSNHAKVKKFLEAVPHIMGLIKDVHCDVQNDDLDSLKSHMNEPVPPIVLSGKDINGLTPLHKAAGLGRQEIAEYIVARFPKSVSILDNEGRTPLHYATVVKDGGKMFDLLLESGADESILDTKQKTAAFYKTRSNEIDARILQVVPECPRMSKDTFPPNWDWSLLTASTPIEEIAKYGKKATDVVFGNSTVTENAKPKNEELANEATDEEKEPNDNALDETTKGNLEENKEDAAPSDVISNDSGIEKEHEENNNPENSDGESHAEAEPEEINKPEEPEPIEEPPQKIEQPKTPPKMLVQSLDESENLDGLQEEPILPEVPDKCDSSKTEDTVVENKPPEAEPLQDENESETNNGSEMGSARTRTASRHSSAMKHTDTHEKTEEIEHGVIDDEGVIEGVVNGENEVESVNEEGQEKAAEDKSSDPEIVALIEGGNMEQLAGLVLNGEGEKLVGQTSANPELQSFLENVPIYMSKINRIHVAARDGSLKDLQAALDRRKFAIAKDAISPNGASPLHVATVFGNTSIVRYLAGRFPETVSAADDNGRTSLHYAATVADNGHYYNLLVHLGANSRTEDTLGHTPDYYKTNQDEFSHRQVLRDFGAEDAVVDEMLNDKVPDDTYSARKDLDDEDMIAVLEKCYNVLHGRRNSNATSAASLITNASSTSSSHYTLSKHIRRYVYDIVKLRITKLDHNLYDIIWPSVKKLPQEPSFRIALEQDFPAGIVAPDRYVYVVFKEFLDPIIKSINSLDIHLDFHDHPELHFFRTDSEIELELDPTARNILGSTLDCTRNLEYFEFTKTLNLGQLEDVERILTSALLSSEVAKALYPNATEEELFTKGSGTYYTMNEVLEDPSEARVILASNGLLIPLWNIAESDRLHGKHWPYGRGVFISNSGNLAAWINVLDHIRIVTCGSQHKPGSIGQIYSRIYRVITALEKTLNFKRDPKLGYLSARPTCLGNTLQFNLTVRFPYLIKEPDNLRHLCQVRGLYIYRSTNTNDVVRIGNQQCLGITELQTFEDFSTAVANILQLEKDLAMSNSLHIAALFVNIFKRKKASVVDNN